MIKNYLTFFLFIIFSFNLYAIEDNEEKIVPNKDLSIQKTIETYFSAFKNSDTTTFKKVTTLKFQTNFGTEEETKKELSASSKDFSDIKIENIIINLDQSSPLKVVCSFTVVDKIKKKSLHQAGDAWFTLIKNSKDSEWLIDNVNKD